MLRIAFQRVALLALALVLSANAQAATDYGDFLGTSVDFLDVSESSSTDAGPLFGTPSAFGDSMMFLPGGFRSISANGSSDSTHGELTLTLRSHADLVLDTITVSHLGDYMLSGAGTPGVSQSVQVLVTGSDLPIAVGAFDANAFELPGDAGFGFIMEDLVLDLSAFAVSEVTLKFTNLLDSYSGSGNTSLIQTKLVQIGATTTAAPVPEPGAMLLFGAGILLVGRRALRTRSH